MFHFETQQKIFVVVMFGKYINVEGAYTFVDPFYI